MKPLTLALVLILCFGCRIVIAPPVTVNVRAPGNEVHTSTDAEQGKSIPVDVGRGAAVGAGGATVPAVGAALGAVALGPAGAALGALVADPVFEAVTPAP